MTDLLSNPSYFIPPLVAGVVLILLLGIALIWSRRDSATGLFVGLLASVALRNFMLFAMRSSPTVAVALNWERALSVFTIIGFSMFFYFTVVYTGTRIWKWFLQFTIVLLLAFIVMGPTDLLIQDMRVEEYGYAPIIGPVSYFFFLNAPLFILGGTFFLIRHFRRSDNTIEKIRLMLLAVASVLPLVGMALDGFTNLPPMSIWTDLLFAVLCTIAITRYHLLDIRIVVRKSLVYVLVSSIAAIPFVTVIIIASQLFGQGTVKWWLYILLLIFLSVILRPLYGWAQNIVDRWMFRERYDYLRELQGFTSEVHYINDINQICVSLVNLVNRALDTSVVLLMLRLAENDYIKISSDSNIELKASADEVIEAFEGIDVTDRVIFRSELESRALQNENLITLLERFSPEIAELFIPIMTKNKSISGVLVLSKKKSDLTFNSEDQNLLLTVTGHLSTELENASLYQNEKIMREELEEQDRMKTEFLNNVAHELNTPLTAMLSSSEILYDEPDIDDKVKTHLISNIHNGTLIMERRVKELLDLARSQIGELKINLRPIDIIRIADESVSQMDILFKNKHQELKTDFPESLPKVMADHDRLQQIFNNLLSNAHKFSVENGSVTVRMNNDGDSVIIRIEDSAPLLNEREINRLFQPYYRGDDEVEREHIPGLGLGLTITKKLVEVHNGRIWVETKEGIGNIFCVAIPIAEESTEA